jgi:small-conductance mechanosensitive channel
VWANVQDYWDIHWKQMRIIKEKIEEAGFNIPYPQRNVQIIQGNSEPVPVPAA